MPTYEENCKRLYEMTNLSYDWNGYDGKTIPVNAIECAEHIIRGIDDKWQPEVYPTGRQSVQLQWKFSNGEYFEYEIWGDDWNTKIMCLSVGSTGTASTSEGFLESFAYRKIMTKILLRTFTPSENSPSCEVINNLKENLERYRELQRNEENIYHLERALMLIERGKKRRDIRECLNSCNRTQGSTQFLEPFYEYVDSIIPGINEICSYVKYLEEDLRDRKEVIFCMQNCQEKYEGLQTLKEKYRYAYRKAKMRGADSIYKLKHEMKNLEDVYDIDLEIRDMERNGYKANE